MKKQILAAFAGVFIILSGLGFIKYNQISKAIAQNKNFAPLPEAVTSIVASEESWDRELSAIGSIVPFQGVTLSAEESGKITKISFESGAAVEQGAALLELDSSVEEANLKSAQARLDWAKKTFTRAQELKGNNAMSVSALENAEAQFRQAEAEVQSLRAVIAKKKISAPFSGRAGIRMVNLGQFVSPGTPIVPLHSLAQVYINFFLPQQTVPQLSVGQMLRLSIDSFPEKTFEGKVNAINSHIDDSTRNIEVQGVLANPEEQLRPGMFARIILILPVQDRFLPLPASSINYATYGDSVYVIESMKDPQGKDYLGVRQQIVQLGPRRGDQVAIVKGIKPGEQVVTSGPFKLRPGAAVVVNNSFVPSNSPAPKPLDT